MATFEEFAQQLEHCVESQDEINAFIAAFARVRIRRIVNLSEPPAGDTWPMVPTVDWTDESKLRASGLGKLNNHEPWKRWLHIDIALGPDQKLVDRYVTMTGVSDKQSRAIFPLLSSSTVRRAAGNASAVKREVRELNGWLHWVRNQKFDPTRFVDYHKNLKTHGNTQNVSGAVGHVGAVCAFLDALDEIAPGSVVNMDGVHVDAETRSPERILAWIDAGGKVPRAALLSNGRAVAFPSDPDVAIFTSIDGKPYKTAADAYAAYDAVRRQPALRRQRIHEFVVGEVKTATDPANLHERLALGSRETRNEVRTDRFLMMSVLTKEILRGGSGKQSGRTLENRDVERFSDVFNLHFAWGWDGGRTRHPEHWNNFKARVKVWCGL
ncbi:hypothetical protein [Methylobacterium sp. 1030]|uniref:hypothetical protein n=1 Tax=Methylobacterium sp. 1030 TaxID=3156404 RepID=UPI0033924AD4